jgi:hypothetical protein
MKNKILFLLLLSLLFSSLLGQELYPQIKSIRLQCRKIDIKKVWKEVASFDLLDGDSGTVLYYSKIGLEKLVHTNFGETRKLITEYYLLDGQLSFVFEKFIIYNFNPAMKEYDPKKSDIDETRDYFEKGNLFHKINNKDCRSLFASDYIVAEDKRIKEEFQRVIDLVTHEKKMRQ